MVRIGGVDEVLEIPTVVSDGRGVDKPARDFDPGVPVLVCVYVFKALNYYYYYYSFIADAISYYSEKLNFST